MDEPTRTMTKPTPTYIIAENANIARELARTLRIPAGPSVGFIGSHSGAADRLRGVGASVRIIVETDTARRRRDWDEIAIQLSYAKGRGAAIEEVSFDKLLGAKRG